MSDPDSSSGDEEPESLVIKRKLKDDFDSLINDWKYYNDLFQQYIPENCCKIFPTILTFLDQRYVQRDTDKLLEEYSEILRQCQELYQSKREEFLSKPPEPVSNSVIDLDSELDELEIAPEIRRWKLPRNIEFLVQKRPKPRVQHEAVLPQPAQIDLLSDYQIPFHKRRRRPTNIQNERRRIPEEQRLLMANDLPNFPSPIPSPPRQTYREWRESKRLLNRESEQPQSRFVNRAKANENLQHHQRQSNSNENNQIMSNSFNPNPPSYDIIQNTLTNVPCQSYEMSNEQRRTLQQPSTSSGVSRPFGLLHNSQIPLNLQNGAIEVNLPNSQQLSTQPASQFIPRKIAVSRDPRLRAQAVVSSSILESTVNVEKEETAKEPESKKIRLDNEDVPILSECEIKQEPEYNSDASTDNEDVPMLSECEIKQEPEYNSDASTIADDENIQDQTNLDEIVIKQEPDYDSNASTIDENHDNDDSFQQPENLGQEQIENSQNVENCSQEIDYASDIDEEIIPYNPETILPPLIKQEMSSQE